MEKETFILRTEWYESIQELDEKSKAELLDNLFLFHLNEETKINLNNLMVKLVWKLIEPNLRRNIESYDKRKSTSSENGKKGGRPPKYQQVTENKKNLNNLNKPNESLSVSVSVSDSDNNVLLEKEPKYILGENEIFEKNNSQISDELNSEKKEKEKSCAKKEKAFSKADFKKSLLDLGVSEQHIDDWFKVRVSKKAQFTETALIAFTNECAKNNFSVAEAVRICAERSWQGFKYQWLLNEVNNGTNQQQSNIGQAKQPYFFDREAAMQTLTGENSRGFSTD